MINSAEDAISLIYSLRERAKELQCIYNVDNALSDLSSDVDSVINRVLDSIPPGWQHPEITLCKIKINDDVYFLPGFKETKWKISVDIILNKKPVGFISVYYKTPKEIDGKIFLDEEYSLLKAISGRVSTYLINRQLASLLQNKNESSDYNDTDINALDKGRIERYLEKPSKNIGANEELRDIIGKNLDFHWKWRQLMAETIVKNMGPKEEAFDRFGVKAVYVLGSVKNAASGPASDIDLLIHRDNDKKKNEILTIWLEGWGLSLARQNFLFTGYETGNLLDIHYITDDDISNGNSYALKINAVTDSAKLIDFSDKGAY